MSYLNAQASSRRRITGAHRASGRATLAPFSNVAPSISAHTMRAPQKTSQTTASFVRIREITGNLS